MTPSIPKILAGIFLPLTLFITGCNEGTLKAQHIHLILHQDNSDSVTNDRELSREFKYNCIETTKILRMNDEMSLMAVNGNSPTATDAEKASPRKIKQFCNQKDSENAPEGTFICDRLQLSLSVINRSELTPVVISQVQANENDRSCQETWLNLSNLVEKRGGKLIILNSTNEGGEGYNQKLWQILHQEDSVKFCGDSSCFKDVITQVRQPTLTKIASEKSVN